MRHDLNYRRVLRTKQDYLFKYKFMGMSTLFFFIFYGIYQERSLKNSSNKFSGDYDKFRQRENENEMKGTEDWYGTPFDRRLHTFIIDLLNVSKVQKKD
jgi:hypothetical protein